MKWWHARFGPSMPQEIIFDVKRWSSAYDFMMDYKKMYPEKIYFRANADYIEVDCKTAFCFAAIRKKLVKAWDISSLGPSINIDSSEGTLNRPLDISDLDVPLADFKLLNMLLSDQEHASIKNLTAEKVNELDKYVVKLKMDIYRWLYVGRSRLGDETGHQIEAIFYGKNVLAKYYGGREKPVYELANGANLKLNKLSYDQMVFHDVLDLQLPDTMTWLTYHQTIIAQPKSNTVMNVFIFQKDTNFLGYLFSYGS